MTDVRSIVDLPSVGGAVGDIHELLDDLIQRFGGDEYIEDLAAARKDYDDRRGRVFEDEDLWEKWTQAFLEWYLLERVPPGADVPPAAIALESDDYRSRAAAVRAVLCSHRSLFEVRSLRPGTVELFDMLGSAEFSVSEERVLYGVSPGDVAELRLIGFEGDVLFGRTFCFHPRGTREAIAAQARRILGDGGDRRDVMDYCASLRIRCERYRHVTASRVYEAAASDFPRGGGFQ